MTFPILSSIVALPLAAAGLLLFIPNRDGSRDGFVRQVALVASLVVFGLTLLLWARFDPASADFQMVERVPWIPAFGIDYFVGVDGISLLLIVLTGFLTPIALLSSWESVT
jgi:NADH-quinone oxidoreductase subunit M